MYRGSGALVSLTVNERILVLSDVVRGLTSLYSEVCVSHRDVKRANVVMDRGCLTVSVTLESLDPSTITTQSSHYIHTHAYRARHGDTRNTSVHDAGV